MKKTIISTAMAAVFGFAAFAPMVASADIPTTVGDGTITFNGQITETNCTVDGDGAAAKGTDNIVVTLPPVSTAVLPEAGVTAGDTAFSLLLSGTNCTDGKTAALWVESTATPALDTATNALRNLDGAGAQNVQVRLFNPANKQVIKLGVAGYVTNGQSVIAENSQPAATITGNKAKLSYVAQYLAVGGGATAGAVTTYLTYSMQYN